MHLNTSLCHNYALIGLIWLGEGRCGIVVTELQSQGESDHICMLTGREDSIPITAGTEGQNAALWLLRTCSDWRDQGNRTRAQNGDMEQRSRHISECLLLEIVWIKYGWITVLKASRTLLLNKAPSFSALMFDFLLPAQVSAQVGTATSMLPAPQWGQRSNVYVSLTMRVMAKSAYPETLALITMGAVQSTPPSVSSEDPTRWGCVHSQDHDQNFNWPSTRNSSRNKDRTRTRPTSRSVATGSTTRYRDKTRTRTLQPHLEPGLEQQPRSEPKPGLKPKLKT